MADPEVSAPVVTESAASGDPLNTLAAACLVTEAVADLTLAAETALIVAEEGNNGEQTAPTGSIQNEGEGQEKENPVEKTNEDPTKTNKFTDQEISDIQKIPDDLASAETSVETPVSEPSEKLTEASAEIEMNEQSGLKENIEVPDDATQSIDNLNAPLTPEQNVSGVESSHEVQDEDAASGILKSTIVTEAPTLPEAAEEPQVVLEPPAEDEIPDQYSDFISGDVASYYEDPLDQYSDYAGGNYDEISLDDISSLNESDTSSIKLKKKSRVLGGLKSIASGGAKIVLGTKDIVYGTGKGTVRAGQNVASGVKHTTVAVGKDVAQATSAVATGTKNAIVTGASAVAHTTVVGAHAIGHGAEAIGHGTVKAAGAVVDGTKAGVLAVGHGTARAAGAVVDGTKTGALAIGHGAEALGHGTVKVAEAMVDGTKAGVLAVGHGTAKAAGAVVDGTKAGAVFIADTTVKAGTAVKDVAVSVADGVKDTTVTVAKAGVNATKAVGHGIENAAHNVADHAQKGMVDALTLGLKIVDSNVVVVPKAITAKPSE